MDKQIQVQNWVWTQWNFESWIINCLPAPLKIPSKSNLKLRLIANRCLHLQLGIVVCCPTGANCQNILFSIFCWEGRCLMATLKGIKERHLASESLKSGMLPLISSTHWLPFWNKNCWWSWSLWVTCLLSYTKLEFRPRGCPLLLQ